MFVTDFVCFVHFCVVTFGSFHFLLVEYLAGMVLLSCKETDEEFNWNFMLSYETVEVIPLGYAVYLSCFWCLFLMCHHSSLIFYVLV